MEYPVLDLVAIGNRIKKLRKENHKKVHDITNFMGLESDQAVYKWQRGESFSTVDNLFALSRLFGTSVDHILQGDETEEDDRSSSQTVDKVRGNVADFVLLEVPKSTFFSTLLVLFMV